VLYGGVAKGRYPGRRETECKVICMRGTARRELQDSPKPTNPAPSGENKVILELEEGSERGGAGAPFNRKIREPN